MTIEQPTADDTNMSWVLNNLVDQQSDVMNAVLFTSDGLVLAHSAGMSRDDADRAAAALSAMKSLQQQLSEFCTTPSRHSAPGPLRYVIADLANVTMVLFAVTERTGIGVSIRGESNSAATHIAIQAATKTVRGLGPILGARERSSGA
ncbi:roadblock/LC7 domain-containing protein [Nonomuraea sp. ATR24]|uniref:roadblock/LC7 domain-containing protein n=1 Tax=Nonomuraea TaxID=83681 RepID=UPI001C60219B|nr:roadblock/LC7 domain-containing protein [Nonomuraea ceibae]